MTQERKTKLKDAPNPLYLALDAEGYGCHIHCDDKEALEEYDTEIVEYVPRSALPVCKSCNDYHDEDSLCGACVAERESIHKAVIKERDEWKAKAERNAKISAVAEEVLEAFAVVIYSAEQYCNYRTQAEESNPFWPEGEITSKVRLMKAKHTYAKLIKAMEGTQND